ncbi:MAG: hypothetical protein LBH00_08095 [Planctomycetaceae bacterium]|jgi:hypothetical protein|nr:hypothetical protein [Planctomycetaceae bacterium]
MLNVFAQPAKTCLAGWSVNGDNTNEPACWKKHPDEVIQLYPALPILTGDAVYTLRPLLEVIYQYHRDFANSLVL